GSPPWCGPPGNAPATTTSPPRVSLARGPQGRHRRPPGQGSRVPRSRRPREGPRRGDRGRAKGREAAQPGEADLGTSMEHSTTEVRAGGTVTGPAQGRSHGGNSLQPSTSMVLPIPQPG